MNLPPLLLEETLLDYKEFRKRAVIAFAQRWIITTKTYFTVVFFQDGLIRRPKEFRCSIASDQGIKSSPPNRDVETRTIPEEYFFNMNYCLLPVYRTNLYFIITPEEYNHYIEGEAFDGHNN